MLVFTKGSWTLSCPQVHHLTAKETEVQRDLRPWFSKCDFWTSSISITWEFVKICILTIFAGDSNVYSCLEALLSDVYIVAQLISD